MIFFIYWASKENSVMIKFLQYVSILLYSTQYMFKRWFLDPMVLNFLKKIHGSSNNYEISFGIRLLDYIAWFVCVVRQRRSDKCYLFVDNCWIYIYRVSIIRPIYSLYHLISNTNKWYVCNSRMINYLSSNKMEKEMKLQIKATLFCFDRLSILLISP